MLDKTLIIDYESGNLSSVFNALQLIKNFDQEIIISNKVSDLKLADRVILPGVGSFASCFSGLRKISGMIKELNVQIIQKNKPFLGICVGMQLLANFGYEYTKSEGLGFINGQVQKIITGDKDLKIPHMGWNNLEIKSNQHPVLQGISSGDHFYFVHSYHFLCDNEEDVLAKVEHGVKINAIIAKNNIIATQFHPEKSSQNGLKMLKNFLSWKI